MVLCNGNSCPGLPKYRIHIEALAVKQCLHETHADHDASMLGRLTNALFVSNYFSHILLPDLTPLNGRVGSAVVLPQHDPSSSVWSTPTSPPISQVKQQDAGTGIHSTGTSVALPPEQVEVPVESAIQKAKNKITLPLLRDHVASVRMYLQRPALQPSHNSAACRPLISLGYVGHSVSTPHHFLIRYATLPAYEPGSFSIGWPSA